MKLVVFSEAGQKKGMGHFVRMSGICDACFEAGYDVTMYLDTDGIVDSLIKKDYVAFHRWTNDDASLRLLDEDTVLIVDSYNVTIDFLKKCKEVCGKMVIIDDNIRLPYENMTILNPNYFAESLNYPSDKENVYYIGKDYTLLRREFYASFTREIRLAPENILITMGGTDVLGITCKAINKIRQLDTNVKLHIVATKAYTNLEEIRETMLLQDQLYMDVNAQGMFDLMTCADFAVASAGGTSNELIKTACPSALVVVADNQALNAGYLNEQGLAIVLDSDLKGIEKMFSYKARKSFIERLKPYVTEKCAADVVMELLKGESNE